MNTCAGAHALTCRTHSCSVLVSTGNAAMPRSLFLVTNRDDLDFLSFDHYTLPDFPDKEKKKEQKSGYQAYIPDTEV